MIRERYFLTIINHYEIQEIIIGYEHYVKANANLGTFKNS